MDAQLAMFEPGTGGSKGLTWALSVGRVWNLSLRSGDVTHVTYLPLSNLNAGVVIKRIYR